MFVIRDIHWTFSASYQSIHKIYLANELINVFIRLVLIIYEVYLNSIKYIIFQLSGVKSELYTVKACLSRGKKIIPRLDPDRDPLDQSNTNNGQPLNNMGINQNLNNDKPFLAGKSARDREEALLCPGGRLLSLNVSGSERSSEFARVLVPYPAAGNWFVTILPSCSKLYSYRRPQDQQDM